MTKSRDEVELNEKSLSLLSLPIEIAYKIVNQAPDSEEIMITLSNTCKHFSFFQPELKKRAAAQLGQYIGVQANEDKAEAMVKANPGLLLVTINEVINKNTNQTIKNFKPLQLAYCEGDIAMCSKLESYFELACGSKEAGKIEIRKQLKEKFGEGYHENTEGKEVRKNRLEAVVQAITNEQFNNGRDAATERWILSEATQIAITKFREEFTASQPKIINNGKRFRLEILEEVCKVYAPAIVRWKNDYRKSALFEDAVLSEVFRYLPTNDAQQFSQGLYYLFEEREKFKRSNTTRDGYDFYLALRKPSYEFVLNGSCLDTMFGDTAAPEWSRMGQRNYTCGPYYENYIVQKLLACRTYAASNETASVFNLSHQI